MLSLTHPHTLEMNVSVDFVEHPNCKESDPLICVFWIDRSMKRESNKHIPQPLASLHCPRWTFSKSMISDNSDTPFPQWWNQNLMRLSLLRSFFFSLPLILLSISPLSLSLSFSLVSSHPTISHFLPFCRFCLHWSKFRSVRMKYKRPNFKHIALNSRASHLWCEFFNHKTNVRLNTLNKPNIKRKTYAIVFVSFGIATKELVRWSFSSARNGSPCFNIGRPKRTKIIGDHRSDTNYTLNKNGI